MMDSFQTEGIILNSLTYKDFDQILTVFTNDHGVIKFFLRNGLKKHAGLATELTRAEFVYRKSQNELHPCQEISLIQSSQSYRKDLEMLEGGCRLVKAIQTSQYPHKPAPLLYRLLTSYLGQLATCHCKDTLCASFLLKLLRHDGLFTLNKPCKICEKELEEFKFVQGHYFCHQHAPSEPGLEFDREESKQIILLAFCQKFDQLKLVSIDKELNAKIILLFQNLIDD